jgi:hypothetical protein
VFVLVWNRVTTYNPGLGPPAAWLVGIARNRAIDRLRAHSARRRAIESARIDAESNENPETDAVVGWTYSWTFASYALTIGGKRAGMGFAGALREIGLPRSDFLMALLTFNPGVVAGQLGVISMAFVLVGLQCRACTWYRRRIVVPASALIACTAVYWTVERLPF